MARLRPAKTNFSRGEIDPLALMRHDTVAFENGAEKLRNVQVFPQGGARRRDGLEHIAEIPDVDATLIPSVAINNIKDIEFQFSITQLYVIIFVREFFYIYRNDVLVFEAAHTYTDAEIPQLNWTQNLDTLFIFHESHEIATLVRQGSDTSWLLSDFILTDFPTVVFDNTALGTLTPSATGDPEGTVNVTSNTAQFVAGDVGKFIRGNGGYGEITSFTSTTVVVLTLVTSFDDANIIGNGLWSKEEIAYSVARGFPVSGTIFQGRLVLAGSKSLPDFLAASRSGVIKNFANSSADDDSAIVAFSDTPGISTFLNVYGGRHLQIFAGDAEFYVPVSEQDPLTPNNVVLRRNSSVGSKGLLPDNTTRINIQTEEADGIVYFIQRGGGALREFVFDDAQFAYDANTVSLVSGHLVRDSVDMALRKSLSIEDPNYIWLVNDDGTLAMFCVLRSEQVNAWTLAETRGDFLQATTLDQDSYFAIRRTINSQTVHRLEKFNPGLLFDSGVIATNLGAPVSSVSNLDWLEGETVEIILDDSFVGTAVITSGVLTFPRDAENSYQFGIPFPVVERDEDDVLVPGSKNNVHIKPLPDDFALADGSTMGKRKRVVNATFRVNKTQGFYLNNKFQAFRSLGSDLLDESIKPFTGDKKIKSIPGWTERGQFDVTQQEPQKFNILGFAWDIAV